MLSFFSSLVLFCLFLFNWTVVNYQVGKAHKACEEGSMLNWIDCRMRYVIVDSTVLNFYPRKDFMQRDRWSCCPVFMRWAIPCLCHFELDPSTRQLHPYPQRSCPTAIPLPSWRFSKFGDRLTGSADGGRGIRLFHPQNMTKKQLKRKPKSWTGCTLCRTARRKCTEEKPQCAHCVRNGYDCQVCRLYFPGRGHSDDP